MHVLIINPLLSRYYKIVYFLLGISGHIFALFQGIMIGQYSQFIGQGKMKFASHLAFT